MAIPGAMGNSTGDVSSGPTLDMDCTPPATWNHCLCRCVRPDEIIPMICYDKCPPPPTVSMGYFQGHGGSPFGGAGGGETVDDVLCADQLIGAPPDPICQGRGGFHRGKKSVIWDIIDIFAIIGLGYLLGDGLDLLVRKVK